MKKNKLIAQGAEAKIFIEGTVIKKDRIPKSYRHPQIDLQLRTRRTRSEAKILLRAFDSGVNVPRVLSQEVYSLSLEFIKGDKLADMLNSYLLKKQKSVMKLLGEQVSLLHDAHLIHGDLTTSNAILSGDKVFLIDFGLGFFSHKIEDKAVDLHLIKQALNAKHFQNHELLFSSFLEGYQPVDTEKILQRLTSVEKRGRYRH